MHRVDTDGNVSGLFTDGDPSIAQQATVVDDDWLNDMQENVAQAIEAATITLVKGTYTQLRDGIKALARQAMQATANTFVDTQTFVKFTSGNAVAVDGNAASPAVLVTAGTAQAGVSIVGSTNAALLSVAGYVDMSGGSTPALSLSAIDELTKVHFAKAWLSAQWTGNKAAGASVTGTATGVNISSANVQTSVSTADSIRVTFAVGFKTSTPPCITGNLSYNDGTGVAQNVKIGFKYINATTLDVFITDNSGAALNFNSTFASAPVWFNVTVFGQMV